MVCVLQSGPHSHEHFKRGNDFCPPKLIAVQTKPRETSMYQFDRFKKGTAVFEYQNTVPFKIHGDNVEYVEYDSANRPEKDGKS